VGGVEILDAPWAERNGGYIGLTRSLVVGPSPRVLKCHIATIDEKRHHALQGRFNSLGLNGPEGTERNFLLNGDRTVSMQREGSRLVLVVEAHDRPLAFQLVIWTVPPKIGFHFFPSFHAKADLSGVRELTSPGLPRWREPIVTTGEVSTDKAPY